MSMYSLVNSERQSEAGARLIRAELLAVLLGNGSGVTRNGKKKYRTEKSYLFLLHRDADLRNLCPQRKHYPTYWNTTHTTNFVSPIIY